MKFNLKVRLNSKLAINPGVTKTSVKKAVSESK